MTPVCVLAAVQVQGIEPAKIAAAQQVSIGKACGTGPGYFKLQLGQQQHPTAHEEPTKV